MKPTPEYIAMCSCAEVQDAVNHNGACWEEQGFCAEHSLKLKWSQEDGLVCSLTGSKLSCLNSWLILPTLDQLWELIKPLRGIKSCNDLLVTTRLIIEFLTIFLISDLRTGWLRYWMWHKHNLSWNGTSWEVIE